MLMVQEQTASAIRMATVDDLPRMEAAAHEFYASSKFLRDFDMARFSSVWKHFMELGSGVIFVCEFKGEIVGALGGLAHRDLYGQEIIAEEFFWFIREESRGPGIRLYRLFEDWARSKGAKWIQMVHLKDLMPDEVADFYERMRYAPIETRYEKRLQ